MSILNAYPLLSSFAQTSPLDQETIMKSMEREFASVPLEDFPCPTLKCSQLSGVLTLKKRKLATYTATEHQVYFSPLISFSDREEKLADIRNQIIGMSIFRQAQSEIDAAFTLDETNTSSRSCGRPFQGMARTSTDTDQLKWAPENMMDQLSAIFLGELPPEITLTPYLKTLMISIVMSIVGPNGVATKAATQESIDLAVKSYVTKTVSRRFFYLVFGSATQYWNLCMPQQAMNMESYSEEYQNKIGDVVGRIVDFLTRWFYVSVIQHPELANDNILVMMPNMTDNSCDLATYVENLYDIGNGKNNLSCMKPTYTLVEGMLEPDLVFGHTLTTSKQVPLADGGVEVLQERPAYGDFLFDSPMVIHYLDPLSQTVVFKSNRMIFNQGCTNMNHIWRNASHGSIYDYVPPLNL